MVMRRLERDGPRPGWWRSPGRRQRPQFL